MFPLNLAQIRSAVPEIFHTQTTNFSQSVLFPKLEVIDTKFLNHTVLENVGLSFVKEYCYQCLEQPTYGC